MSSPQKPLQDKPFTVRYREFTQLTPDTAIFAPGGTLQTENNGIALLDWPFNVGKTTVYHCTRLNLVESHMTPGGGLRVFWRVSQAPFCFRRAKMITITAPKTNNETRYEYDVQSQRAKVTGTEIGIGVMGDNTALFAVGQGSADLAASNGDTADVTAGEMGLASPKGIIIMPIPEPSFTLFWDGDNAKFFAPYGVTVEVDGQPIELGRFIHRPSVVVATNPMGRAIRRIVRQYPHPSSRGSVNRPRP
jgi:hypothetical protein